MTTREVVLEGGSPWGFRIHGGVDSGSPLRISRVNSNGKAALKGIQEGDIISSINGHPTKNFSCSEAHTFIKKSRDTLKLELSNDSGSTRQRKRNKATIHETNSETVKSTSSTLYTRISSKTIFSDDTNDYDPGPSFRKQPSLEGQNRSKEYTDPPLSPNSTVSSDVSSSSTLTEAGKDRRSITDVTSLQINIDMGDRANSKSKKKRSKKQRKKSKKASENTKYETNPICETLEETVKTEDVVSEDYKVDFPDTVTSNPKVKVKSKSLDDEDDSLKIQEITECTEEGKEECDAVISEADSDWEEATDLRVPRKPISLSTIAISIDEDPLQRIEILSPEEELSLRNFLEDINLVSVAKPSSTKSSLDSIKTEKARKRDALVTYFKPLVCNPRYLDIISEEGSDSSDRETPSLTVHLKQGTPELESAPKGLVQSNSKIVRKRELKRACLPRNRDRAVLVCTKVINTPSIIEHIHTRTTENTEAEKVFLESASASSNDSSESEEISFDEKNSDGDTDNTDHESENLKETCVSDSESTENNSEFDDDNVMKNIVQSSKLSNLNIINKTNQTQFVSEYGQNYTLNGNITAPSICIPNIASLNKISSDNEKMIPTYYGELTPPPTPDSSPKNKLSAKSSIDLDECMRQISTDTAREITSVLYKLTEACTSTVIVNQAFTNSAENSINSVSSRSPSRSSSSSRETSPSTVRYNQMNSSIADVTSILPDLELAKEALFLKQPPSLRQICLNFLLSLPCGAEMLQELCDISLNLDKLTQALNHTQNLLESDASARLSNHESISESTEKLKNTMWTGLPFQSSPNVLLCLSPKQRAYLDKSGVSIKEPELLFDLHNKFANRADQNHFRNNAKDDIEITSIQNIDVNSKVASDMNYSTLPKNFKHFTHNPRLQASNLGEWLRIARNDTTPSQSYEILNSRNHIAPSSSHSINDNSGTTRRRASLPDDLCKRQMNYILEKEKEIERELHELLQEKRRLYLEIEGYNEKHLLESSFDQGEKARPKSFPCAPGEIFRQKMYEEYMDQVAEREERKQHKVIKITSTPSKKSAKKEEPILEVTHMAELEDEFMKKVQDIHGPLHKDKEGEETEEIEYSEFQTSEHESVILMDGTSLRGASSLPKHLKEFVEIASECSKVANSPDSTNGVWSPGQKQEFTSTDIKNHQRNENDDGAIPTIWQPKSATSSPSAERKEFRAVSFESPKLSRKNKSEEVLINFEKSSTKPPWQASGSGSETGIHPSASLEKQFPSSHLTPVAGYNDFTTSRLPRAQNPTITLLQKAREGQLPKGAIYIEANREHYNIPHESARQGEILQPRRSDFLSESDSENSRRMVDSSRRKINGVGPITKDGMPLSLRSEVKDSNQSKWYKKMYDTIHKQKPYRDEYVTVRYKQRRAQYPYITGYLSEPEPGAYDSDHMDYKYATLDRRRTPISEKENFATSTMPRNIHLKTSSSFDTVHYNPGSKLNPGRIENYTPGHSSIQEQESKRNFAEEKKPVTKGYMSQALKESGYESDSTLIFKRKEEGSQLSPSEQREAYKVIQKGGDIPLHGLRKTVPERPKDPEPPLPPPKGHHGPRETQQGSPKKYVENQVTIHYKAPVRQEIKEYYSEDELAHRQQEAMKKIYQEERRRKYLQVSNSLSKSFDELQDMHNRRHTDNFISSQKSPIALNRYDDFDELVSPQHKIRPRSPEPRLVARALYNFVGMTPRELTFRKGDNIYVRRQIDKNWYEGELNAMVGLFPVNYVEIIPYENVRTTLRKPNEGQARAKYNFMAKTHLELSLAKGEMVIITRRVDNNWYEGKIGGRRGIFPASYVDVLIDPQEATKDNPKPIAAPAAHSLLLNGSNARESMGSHTYTPNLPNPEPATATRYFAKPVQTSYCSYENRNSGGSENPISRALHIDTQSAEPSSYRALYKYLPQNDDELELMEGDKIYVLEKCDDGWYVGSNERTGAFGTFPGNYVDKM